MLPDLSNPIALATIVVMLPLVIAALAYLISLVPEYGGRVARDLCVLTSYGVLALTIILVETVIAGGPFKGTVYAFPLPVGVVRFSLYLDALAMIPTIMSAVFAALALTFSLKYFSRENRYHSTLSTYNVAYSFMLVFLSSMIGACFSSNIILITFFWEMTGLCSYALVAFWHEESAARAAALKTFIITHVGTLGLLLGAIIIYPATGSLEIHDWSLISSMSPIIPLAMALIFIGILPKAVQFPLHVWLPDATAAPTPVTAYVHVVGFLMGLYAFPRFFGQVFVGQIAASPVLAGTMAALFGELRAWNFLIAATGAVTMMVAAFFSLVERDIKKLVAYILISSLGATVLALGLGTGLGVAAGLFAIVPHVFYCGLLFLAAGSAIFRTGKTSINLMGGLQRRMPVTTACGVVGVLSSASFPFLGYFTALWLTIHALIEVQAPAFLIVILLGSILKAVAALRLFHSTFLGNSQLHRGDVKEVSYVMLLPMLLLSFLLIVVGVFPQAVIESIILPSVSGLGVDVGSIVAIDEIVTSSGLWNPVLGTMTGLAYIGIIGTIVVASSATSGQKRANSEDALKPFLFGEDVVTLTQVPAYHLYNTSMEVLKIRRLAHATNVDRLFYWVSSVFSGASAASLRLDVNQQYYRALLYFIVGTAIILVCVMVGG
jgi:NADH-quinone oxidoreductase subunit L